MPQEPLPSRRASNGLAAFVAVIVICLDLSAAFASAGMPSVTLTDVTRARVDSISFFGVGLLISAAGVRRLWNSLIRDFPGWPRLSYPRALGWTVLWGLMFLMVLTMISGARELLTPGAWEKTGLTYRLKDGMNAPATRSTDDARSMDNRRRTLEALRVVLWTEAATHDGTFPASRETAPIARELWVQPAFPTVEYLYRPGLRIGGKAEPLVIEYDLYGDGQLSLFTDGAIRLLPPEAGEMRTPGHSPEPVGPEDPAGQGGAETGASR